VDALAFSKLRPEAFDRLPQLLMADLGLIRNSIGMHFKLLPQGGFQMADDKGSSSLVSIESFYMGIHEVTQEQWEQVMGTNPARFKVENKPAERISWDDAVAFCAKLSASPEEVAAGRVYRLPREDEWEYACRAGSTAEYSFGDDVTQLPDYAWFIYNSGLNPISHESVIERFSISYDEFIDMIEANSCGSHPVGTKLSNGWGLFDMHGNMWEWCQDEVDSKRVYRGGAWIGVASECRSGIRNTFEPSRRSLSSGFRVALNQ
jgi:formylglycine-generating enzyme required for sulfatase activity